MTTRVGILGLGFMGVNHYRTYARIPAAQVVAICDVDPRKRAGDWSGAAGNIGETVNTVDVSGLQVTAEAEALMRNPEVDVVDITLPTYLHADYAVRAMEAGKHVICEKPMALTPAEAQSMLDAARRTGRQLYVAQCIRFWPQYAAARDIVRSGQYGRVRSAFFVRRSSRPTWSWEHWLMDEAKSGGCVQDLHIHDADFVLHCFGQPASVSSVGVSDDRYGNVHCLTTYHYADDDALIVAEGGWGYPGAYPFSMTFSIAMEQATLRLDETGALTVYPVDGDASPVAVDGEDGYFHELTHFVQCIAGGTPSDIITPESAYQALCLITAEKQAMRQGCAAPCGV